MEGFWARGPSSVREIQDGFADKSRPAYTTVQTVVYRLEAKQALRRLQKIGNAHIFEATVSRNAVQRSLIEELLVSFGGRMQPIMTHLVETGRLTLEDVQQAERHLRELKARKVDRR